jgi:hypothetical protein
MNRGDSDTSNSGTKSSILQTILIQAETNAKVSYFCFFSEVICMRVTFGMLGIVNLI